MLLQWFVAFCMFMQWFVAFQRCVELYGKVCMLLQWLPAFSSLVYAKVFMLLQWFVALQRSVALYGKIFILPQWFVVLQRSVALYGKICMLPQWVVAFCSAVWKDLYVGVVVRSVVQWFVIQYRLDNLIVHTGETLCRLTITWLQSFATHNLFDLSLNCTGLESMGQVTVAATRIQIPQCATVKYPETARRTIQCEIVTLF